MIDHLFHRLDHVEIDGNHVEIDGNHVEIDGNSVSKKCWNIKYLYSITVYYVSQTNSRGIKKCFLNIHPMI